MKNLKTARQAKGYTQEKLADMLDVTRLTVARYEAGDREPSLAILEKMADILGTTTDHLLGRDTPAPKEKAPAPEEQGQSVMVKAARDTKGQSVDEARVREIFEEMLREQRGK